MKGHSFFVNKSTTVHTESLHVSNDILQKKTLPQINHQRSQNSVEKNMKIICKKPQLCGHKALVTNAMKHA